MNPLIELHEQGQSFWLDFIRRRMFKSGELSRWIKRDGLRGMTSNPTIFQKAIAGGDEYDAQIKKLARTKRSAKDIFDAIAIQDIQAAADMLKPVHKSSGGKDGFVSLEVNPHLAFRTAESLEEARRLARLVRRPNLMVKIPGTAEGLPAIEEATFAGLNINITLLFDVEIYKRVVEAYISGLERRVKKGLPIKSINSVASFFVSRVDTIVNKELDRLIEKGARSAETAGGVLHRIAIANAKIAYAHYGAVMESDRWKKLAAKGANAQRLLWASTSAKDKRMRDVAYVEELIGPDTVNTMPPATAEAFRDHGRVEATLTAGVQDATDDIRTLEEIGVDLKAATDRLQREGVEAFIHSYDDLLRVVAAKRELLLAQSARSVSVSMRKLKSDFETNLARIEKEKWIDRIWSKDASLWKPGEDHQKIIKNSLGWLTVTDAVEQRLPELEAIARDVKKANFSHVLLLGMGGSSLCPEVIRLTFGRKAGFPDFAILDSTEPGSVRERANWSKRAEKTLYIVASKSGSTTEPNAFMSYFYDLVKRKKGNRAGENFIAITDPGTVLASMAKQRSFRHVVVNPADIGGRYSALSFFGMVPAAIMGIDLRKFLGRAGRAIGASQPLIPVRKNPGVLLGAALGTAARAGRNKITFILSKEISSFGTWAEQLLAESTGKEGKGVLPVESEALQPPASYADDRVFVSIRTAADKSKRSDAALKALEKAGHPVIRVSLKDKFDLAGQFFVWEIATAVLGALLGINPFDQPNVQEAKDKTKQLIDQFKAKGAFPQEPAVYEDEAVTVYLSRDGGRVESFEAAVSAFLKEANPRDYVALLAYLTRERKVESALQDIRHAILKKKKLATTIGFGPRYLHSTGQYHKGGDNSGLFISITANDREDIAIPGEGISYSVLKEAQARGDWEALKSKDRRVMHIHLRDFNEGLKRLKQVVEKVSLN